METLIVAIEWLIATNGCWTPLVNADIAFNNIELITQEQLQQASSALVNNANQISCDLPFANFLKTH